jgi:hypothetical protein
MLVHMLCYVAWRPSIKPMATGALAIGYGSWDPSLHLEYTYCPSAAYPARGPQCLAPGRKARRDRAAAGVRP